MPPSLSPAGEKPVTVSPVVVSEHTAIAAFLRTFRPPPLDLTVIHPERKKNIRGRTFTNPEHAAAACVAIQEQGFNVYFSIAELMRPLTREEPKASKEEVRSISYLFADLDANSEKEKAWALRRLQSIKWKPTGVVDSGGGYWGFWRLSEPFAINGQEAAWRAFERYNYGLGKLLGADHCFNCDRIARLPGTVNFPDKKKRKKGRTAVLARVVEWDSAMVYNLADFEAIAQDPPEDKETAIVFPSDLPTLSDSEVEFIERLSAERYPPDHYPADSRNERQLAITIGLVWTGWDNARILAALLDERTWVGRAVLFTSDGAARPRAREYAERQVERAHGYAAREFVEEPECGEVVEL